MSRRRTLEHHRHSLAEIRDIMNSMKTLAYLETRKLARFLDAQQRRRRHHRDSGGGFTRRSTRKSCPGRNAAKPVFLLFGADRGFCGDFNRALLRHLQATLQAHPGDAPALIAIGRKLHTLLDRDARVVAWIEGAGVVEEITAVLNRLADEIIALQGRPGGLEVFCIYHGSDDGVVMQRLLPPFAGRPADRRSIHIRRS